MKISVIGTGYVGLVQGIVLAEFGMQVICMDTDKDKIKSLNQGKIPIYEPGLEAMLHKNSMRIEFTSDMSYAVKQSDVIFIAVGTPANEDGSADLSYVLSVAKSIGQHIDGYKVIVNKSTVPVGTADKVAQVIFDALGECKKTYDFDVVSNPEFLREGKAIQDSLQPNRVVIGSSSKKAIEYMDKVYKPLKIKQVPFVYTDTKSSELIKYAANAFLAVKIAYINEFARLSESVGANIQDIAKGIGLDKRIAPDFLQCGPGYGGSCFPKDTLAIVSKAQEYKENFSIIEAAVKSNEDQKSWVANKIKKQMHSLDGRVITMLGLTFKADTDDMRDSPALNIIPYLINHGAVLQVFCPQGMDESQWRLSKYSDSISYCVDEYDAAKNADAIVILTEWSQFGLLDLSKLKSLMCDSYFFDFRNIFVDDDSIRNKFKYYPIGCK